MGVGYADTRSCGSCTVSVCNNGNCNGAGGIFYPDPNPCNNPTFNKTVALSGGACTYYSPAWGQVSSVWVEKPIGQQGGSCSAGSTMSGDLTANNPSTICCQ